MQYSYSQFWSLHSDSLNVRHLHLIVPNIVSTLHEFVDLQRENDNVEVHFLSVRAHLQCGRLSPSSLL